MPFLSHIRSWYNGPCMGSLRRDSVSPHPKNKEDYTRLTIFTEKSRLSRPGLELRTHSTTVNRYDAMFYVITTYTGLEGIRNEAAFFCFSLRKWANRNNKPCQRKVEAYSRLPRTATRGAADVFTSSLCGSRTVWNCHPLFYDVASISEVSQHCIT
jgi:hypothetical protein